MWQITQTPIFIQQRWRALCFVRLGSGIPIRGQLSCFMGPEINFGFTSEFSRTHGTMPPINLRVEMKACFCWIKWLTSNIRHNRNNFHLTWESTFPTGAWALTAWAVFPRPVGVTIRGNLIGLPLLRVVNNSDRWMRKAWEWREASHVVRTRFGTRLSPVGDRLFRSPNSTTISQVMLSIGPNQ